MTDRILLKAIAGSKAYGLELPTSDTDIRMVSIKSLRELYGFLLDSPTDQREESSDVTIHEIAKFFQLAMKGGPTLTELLFLPEDCILYKHPLMEFDGSIFLSCKTFYSYLGWVTGIVADLDKFTKTRYEKPDKETKEIVHALRLLWTAEKLGETGKLQVRLEGEKLQRLREIRISESAKYKDFEKEIKDKLEVLRSSSFAEHMALPVKPDPKKIEELLIGIRTEYYKFNS